MLRVCVCVHARVCVCMCAVLSFFSRAILGDLLDCSLPASSVHDILQVRILEWVAMLSSRGSSWPRGWTCGSCISCIAGGLFTAEPLGKPPFPYIII